MKFGFLAICQKSRSCQSPLILGEFRIIYVSKQVCINSTYRVSHIETCFLNCLEHSIYIYLCVVTSYTSFVLGLACPNSWNIMVNIYLKLGQNRDKSSTSLYVTAALLLLASFQMTSCWDWRENFNENDYEKWVCNEFMTRVLWF